MAGMELRAYSRRGPQGPRRSRQVVREPIHALLELPIGHLALTAGHSDPIAKRVCRMLKEVCDIQGHGNESRTCYRFQVNPNPGVSEEIIAAVTSTPVPADETGAGRRMP